MPSELDAQASLEELVDRAALGEMVQSFFDLFQLPIRVYSSSGHILADATEQPALYAYLNGLAEPRRKLADVVFRVKAAQPEGNEPTQISCITGASYRVFAVTYDHRELGRVILGPYLPAEINAPPRELVALEGVDEDRVVDLMHAMARARDTTVNQIGAHLQRTLDLILFSGHKALLTSSMHLASVRENYRDLKGKNVKLQHAYDRLKELDRLKSNFLATVSHELRTPLTSIIGYSEMLREGIAGDLGPEQVEFVSTIHEKGEQLLELIKGLLDLSKLESGTLSLRKSEVQVEPIARDVVQTLTPSARKKQVKLYFQEEGAGPALVWGDPQRLRQVLLNLTENALKFTPPEGEVRLSLSQSFISRERDGEDRDSPGLAIMAARRAAVEIRVTDTGVGIPEGERGRVFDAFYQVDGSSTREHGGTGLGLSIVKRLVEAHDGTVHIDGNRPQGVVFVVRIPCRRATLS